MKNPLHTRIGLAIAAAVLTLFPATAWAQDFGLGIVVGQPTGFTAKIFTGSRTAFDVDLAYDFDKALTVLG
ncbi:MAG TPA: hypothetical protein VL588_07195, partial [Bdellovibrionota bacterium]|nr:hypothetical protein [Bdellovibrionota bacterium]